MPAGFEAYTENGGVVQIDDRYPVMCLRYTGAATVVNRHPASALGNSSLIAKTVDITVSAEDPQFFIQGPGRYGVIAITKSGSQWTFRVIGYDDKPTFNYFIFDRPTTTPANGAGLEVFDAQGKIVFSSLWRPMAVAGFSTMGNTDQLPSGRSYAFGFGSCITLQETSETFTDQSIYTFWTYRLVTASTAPQPGSSVLAGRVFDDPIAGGVNQGGQAPSYPTGDLGGWGADSTLTVIDVTDLVGAPGNVTAPVVSVNTTFRTVSGTSGTTITDAVTCSASGGAGGPYSFLWDKVGGDSAIVFYGATNGASMRTQWVNQPAGTSAQAQFRCRVTDGAGNVTYSSTVTFEHIQGVIDRTPDALGLTDQVISTNENYAQVGVYRTLAGFNQTITIRVTTSQQSGNISAGGVYLQKNGVNHPDGVAIWTDGAISREWTYVPGDQLGLVLDAQTFSGVKSGKFLTTITNVSTGATMGSFWTQCDVDRDNNYQVVDTAPDYITNWPEIKDAVNEDDFEWSTSWSGEHYVTGINAPITMRAQAYGYYDPGGNVALADVQVCTIAPGTGGWAHRGSFNAKTSGWLDLPNITNGTRVALNPRIATANGRASCDIQLVLWSLTGPSTTLFASAVSKFTVDNDNSSDRIPDGISLPTISLSTTANVGNSTGQDVRNLTGFTQPITISMVMGGRSGGVDGGRLRLVRYTPAQGWIEAATMPLSSPTGTTVSSTFLPGDSIYTDFLDASTNSGRKQMSATIQVNNATMGQLMTQHLLTVDVDSDNNYNVQGPPVVSIDNGYVYRQEFIQSGEYTSVFSDIGDVNVTVSGAGPFTYAWTKVQGSNSTWAMTGTTQPQFRVSGYTTFQEYAVWRLVVTDSQGRASDPVDVEVTLGAGDQA